MYIYIYIHVVSISPDSMSLSRFWTLAKSIQGISGPQASPRDTQVSDIIRQIDVALLRFRKMIEILPPSVSRLDLRSKFWWFDHHSSDRVFVRTALCMQQVMLTFAFALRLSILRCSYACLLRWVVSPHQARELNCIMMYIYIYMYRYMYIYIYVYIYIWYTPPTKKKHLFMSFNYSGVINGGLPVTLYTHMYIVLWIVVVHTITKPWNSKKRNVWRLFGERPLGENKRPRKKQEKTKIFQDSLGRAPLEKTKKNKQKTLFGDSLGRGLMKKIKKKRKNSRKQKKTKTNNI